MFFYTNKKVKKKIIKEQHTPPPKKKTGRDARYPSPPKTSSTHPRSRMAPTCAGSAAVDPCGASSAERTPRRPEGRERENEKLGKESENKFFFVFFFNKFYVKEFSIV